MTSLIPVWYKDKSQLISQRCAVHSLHPFLLSLCSETYQSLPTILISLTNVNFPDDIKNNLRKNVFLKSREKRQSVYTWPKADRLACTNTGILL